LSGRAVECAFAARTELTGCALSTASSTVIEVIG
jgi:hypothetical protein